MDTGEMGKYDFDCNSCSALKRKHGEVEDFHRELLSEKRRKRIQIRTVA